jgi:hypothetical protein
MADYVELFPNCPVAQAIKLARVHQAEEAARQEEQARKQEQGKIIEIFREFLLDEYDPEILQLAERSLSAATEHSYKSDIADFEWWCAKLSELVGFEFRPWPAVPETVAFYLRFERESGGSSAALKRRFAALGHAHRTKNLVDPCRGAFPDGADGEMFVDWKPFPNAILMRARHEDQKTNEGG